MEENIYQTPKAPLTTPEPAKGSPIKAILIATIVDIGGTLMVGFLISMGYIVIQTSKGVPTKQAIKHLGQMELYAPVSLLGLALGFAITLYAGYLCAKIAQRSIYRVVTVFSIIIIGFSIMMTVSYYSVLEHILLNMLALFSAYLGAWWYVHTKAQAR
ncbi:MAG: hypothetical protein SVR94_12990 [Pseudomonadota bacterium]|nr:hypothetical protein [Pseudomonadota bacterium]